MLTNVEHLYLSIVKKRILLIINVNKCTQSEAFLGGAVSHTDFHHLLAAEMTWFHYLVLIMWT